MIAMIAANDSGANQAVAPHGSDEGRLGTNPIAVGIPRSAPPHLVLDMATSVVSHGTVELARLAGDPVPIGWTAATNVLLPLAGPKGTGLALVVDVLAGILTGAGFSTADLVHGYQGVWLLALDPERFLAPGRLETDIEALVDHVHSAQPVPGGAVLVPGEPAERARRANLADGVPLPAHVWTELRTLAERLGVEIAIHPNEGDVRP